MEESAGTRNTRVESVQTVEAQPISSEKPVTKTELEALVENTKIEIRQTGENAVTDGTKLIEKATQTGNELGLSTEEIQSALQETRFPQSVGSVNEQIHALTEKALGHLNTSETKPLPEEEMKLGKKFQDVEVAYLAKKVLSAKGLDKRYEDPRSGAAAVQQNVAEFAARAGVASETIPEIANQPFNAETRKIISARLKQHLDALFSNKERGRVNPEKHQIMLGQTERYLDLMAQAQQEGDVNADLDANTLFLLAERNLEMAAFQDRVASENMLGDHGVRHLVGYNIRMTEAMLDSLAEKGQPVRAIDRIMGHQIMLMHDLGYATDPVREEINKGNMPADKGHNLLSAKILRELAADPNDPLARIFSKDSLSTIHKGVLEHDDARVEFHVGENTSEARKENLLSAIHLADNTHAFEDKLPELLYSVPDSLKTMRLLKTAGEIGDMEMVSRVKADLIATINASENYSEDDKEALTQAVSALSENSFKFSVGRICGNSPSVSIGPDGRVTISVQESAIHQETVGLFDQKAYNTLKKFIADLSGKAPDDITDEMLSQDKLESGKVTIELAIGDKKAAERTDYQSRIEAIVSDEPFVEFSRQDLALSRRQKALEARVKAAAPQTEQTSAAVETLTTEIEATKRKRQGIYRAYAGITDQPS